MDKVKYLDDNPAENVLIKFPDQFSNLGPTHPAWTKRVALEIQNLMKYIDYLMDISLKWFFLKPCDIKSYNYQRWDGYLKIASREDIQFELRIILTSEYPKVFPRAFVEESIISYCAGNIFPHQTYEDVEQKGKKFVMICHDHMNNTEAWHPTFSIAHFFLREVWYWWTAKTNRIIFEWDNEKR